MIPLGLVAFFPLNVLLLLSEHEKYFQSVFLNDLLSGLPFLVPTQKKRELNLFKVPSLACKTSFKVGWTEMFRATKSVIYTLEINVSSSHAKFPGLLERHEKINLALRHSNCCILPQHRIYDRISSSSFPHFLKIVTPCCFWGPLSLHPHNFGFFLESMYSHFGYHINDSTLICLLRSWWYVGYVNYLHCI